MHTFTVIQNLRRITSRHARELTCYTHYLSRKSLPRILMFAAGDPSDASSLLRVYFLGSELRRQGWDVIMPHFSLSLQQRERLIRKLRPDAILLQQCRHPLHRPKYYGTVPVFFDLDDAEFQDPVAALIVRECCETSFGVIAGSRYVANWCRKYNRNVKTVWTCTPARSDLPISPPRNRRPVIAWAAAFPLGQTQTIDVLVEVMYQLRKRLAFAFHIYGINDLKKASRLLDPLAKMAINITTYRYMNYEKYLQSLGSAAVGIQPVDTNVPFNLGKSFGKILGYLQREVAVIASNNCDHPLFFEHGVNGELATGVDDWVDSCERLLSDINYRTEIVRNGCNGFEKRLTTPTAARLVADFIFEAL